MSGRRVPIRVMPPDLALKIAAGEVVERPASALKELLDNAVDAGATTIKVEVREAGLKLLRVTDNGCGIPREELPLAFASHATNKIGSLADLEQLATLGFRGEALPSIAAVSRVEVQTRVPGEATGARFCVEYGRAVAEGMCAASEGLRITVFDLFSNVPARRKFVRSLRAESGQIQSVVTQYALAQPGIRLDLSIDGRSVFHSAGTGRLSDALAAVHGADALGAMRALEAEESAVCVEGLISTPALTRQNRAAIYIFVNGRPIQNRSLVFALEEAYSGYVMTGRHPLAAVHLTIPPDEVDVNIHPAKSEVRLARDREVHAALHRAVANSLLEMRLDGRPLANQARSSGDETPLGAEVEPVQNGIGQWSEARKAPPSEETLNATAAPLMTGLPALRVFGQSNQTFIIAEGPNGLYMIDQHAAHERVLFDRLEQQLERGEAPAQPLLEPAAVELTPSMMLALDENRDLLSRLGFQLEPFGDTACLIRAVPVLARRNEPTELVMEVLEELQNNPEPAAARERALASVACKAAVKAGHTLEVQEMRELVAQLERTLRPSTCPHGRPTMIHLSHSQLEREFGRI